MTSAQDFNLLSCKNGKLLNKTAHDRLKRKACGQRFGFYMLQNNTLYDR